jgi:hypothetical protein
MRRSSEAMLSDTNCADLQCRNTAAATWLRLVVLFVNAEQFDICVDTSGTTKNESVNFVKTTNT